MLSNTRDVVIAVRVQLCTATFFGYARLHTARCEGETHGYTQLTTNVYQSSFNKGGACEIYV